MKTPLFFALIFLSVPAVFHAQTITWQELTSTYNLPSGLRFFRGSTGSNPGWQAWYYEVDMTNPNIAIRPYWRNSPAQVNAFAQEVGAYAAINGGFFSGNTSVSSVIYPQEVPAVNIQNVTRNGSAYPVIRPVFAINNDFTMATEWVYHHSFNRQDIYRYPQPLPYSCNDPFPRPAPLQSQGTPYDSIAFGIGGGPQLIKQSVVDIAYCEEIFWGSGVFLTDVRPRTAVGYTLNQKAILFATNNMRMDDMAELLRDLGCYEAINLDGGGSTAISAAGQSIFSQNRAVPSILAVVPRDAFYSSNQPVFEQVIDTSDSTAICVGNWFPSANSGAWTSPSLLHALGSNAQYCAFPLQLPAPATYLVYAWWTAHPNRASNTPFTVQHANGASTVNRNQTVNGSSWNLIGSFQFNGNHTEEVRVTAAASTNQFVVADALKIVSYDPGTAVATFEPATTTDDLKVYPNPSPGKFTLEYSGQGIREIQVFNAVGERVYRTFAEGPFLQAIDLKKQAPGLYAVALKGTEKTIFKKLVLHP
jgi:hypothetical protein